MSLGRLKREGDDSYRGTKRARTSVHANFHTKASFQFCIRTRSRVWGIYRFAWSEGGQFGSGMWVSRSRMQQLSAALDSAAARSLCFTRGASQKELRFPQQKICSVACNETRGGKPPALLHLISNNHQLHFPRHHWVKTFFLHHLPECASYPQSGFITVHLTLNISPPNSLLCVCIKAAHF